MSQVLLRLAEAPQQQKQITAFSSDSQKSYGEGTTHERRCFRSFTRSELLSCKPSNVLLKTTDYCCVVQHYPTANCCCYSLHLLEHTLKLLRGVPGRPRVGNLRLAVGSAPRSERRRALVAHHARATAVGCVLPWAAEPHLRTRVSLNFSRLALLRVGERGEQCVEWALLKRSEQRTLYVWFCCYLGDRDRGSLITLVERASEHRALSSL